MMKWDCSGNIYRRQAMVGEERESKKGCKKTQAKWHKQVKTG